MSHVVLGHVTFKRCPKMLSVLKEGCNIPRRPSCLEILNFLLNYSGRILFCLAYCPEFLTVVSGGGVFSAWEN